MVSRTERWAAISRDPDEDLLNRIGRGDAAAVTAMIARKLPRLLSLATRMLRDRSEAEDVAQEVFLRIWRHAAAWKPGDAMFDTWMHKVALNLCYDRMRLRRDVSMAEPPEAVDLGPLPDAGLMEAAGSDRIGAALAALPPRQREAIVLFYYQEMSNADAAALMDIHVEALESLLARGRRNLRALLKEDGYVP